MERYETGFDFFSEEPALMVVKEIEDGEEEEYECILRIRIWNRKKESYSWSIYARERQKLNNLIIRKVTWDMDKDIEFTKKTIKENREMILTSCPSLTMYNRYLPFSCSSKVIQDIERLDSKIENGFVLHNTSDPEYKWRDVEILRIYDWGQIHFTWSTDKRNAEVEKRIQELILNLDANLAKDLKKVFSLTLIYDTLPDLENI